MLLLVSSAPRNFSELSFTREGLCQILGNIEGCSDILVYSAGVVEKNGRIIGYPVELYLAVTHGSGAVFIYAEPLVDETFALFARVAALVGSTAAGAEFDKYNYYILIKSPTAKARGPSLSAALGAGFALAILGIDLGGPIAITGILMPDGGIGYVGYLAEKVLAMFSVARKVFIPAGGKISVLANGTPLDLVDFGRAVGVNVFEVFSISELLEYLGIGPRFTSQYAEKQLETSRAALKLVGYLGEAIEKSLGNVTAACGEEVAGELAVKLKRLVSRDLGKPLTEGVIHLLWRLMSALVEVESAAWTCGIERGYTDLRALADKALERLRSAESACYLYSRTASTLLRDAVLLSTSYWFLIDSWEEFNESMSVLSAGRGVYGLVRSMLVADLVLAILEVLSSESTEGMDYEIDLRRIQLLLNYASTLVDSLSERLARSSRSPQSKDVLERYLQAGISQLFSNPALSLAYILKVLYELSFFTYCNQYSSHSYIVETSRTRAAGYAALTEDPTIYALIELGDSCAESGEELAKCLSFYLKASVLGFAANYLVVRRATAGFQGFTWYWVLAPVTVVAFSIAVALLLRKEKVFFLRSPRYPGLRQPALRRTRAVRR